ncbi:hypothetical protein FGF1_20130 [Flavobacteriaceae bacterium GF1]
MGDCFPDVCDCTCNQPYNEFESIISKEISFPFSFDELCHSNIGWFTDEKICNDHHLNDWIDASCYGIYLLWHKDDYCATHNMFHMKGLYVGKGNIKNRIISHFKKKDFSNEMIVYFTFIEMINRRAKFLEQLLLDHFNFPFNKNENNGKKKLCSYFSQIEVD